MHVHAYSGTGAVIGAADGAWRTLSVEFRDGVSAAEIASIEMHHGAPGEITVQISSSPTGSFFQAADLGGTGQVWPSGLAATVTFAEATDMSAVTIDYISINTYLVVPEDYL